MSVEAAPAAAPGYPLRYDVEYPEELVYRPIFGFKQKVKFILE